MAKPIGGRGHKAPYKTTIIRVPIDLVDKIDSYCDQYRLFLETGKDKGFLGKLDLDDLDHESGLDPDQALQKAKDILNQKKSAKVSLKKMLQVIYGDKLDSDLIDNLQMILLSIDLSKIR